MRVAPISAAVLERPAPARWMADARTNIGLRRRTNEDFCTTAEFTAGGRGYACWVVADGMGGTSDGEDASRLATETAVHTLQSMTWIDTRDALNAAFQAANTAVYEEARRRGKRMGTTMVAAFIDLSTAAVWIANVGDSRAYLLSGGEIRQITDDHSMVAEQVAAGLMDEEQATHAPHQNVITRAIGIEPTVMVDVFGPRRLQPGELLLLSSDGLHRLISDDEIREIACTTPFATLMSALVDAALARGGRDNITVVAGGQGLDSSQPSCRRGRFDRQP